MNTFMYRGHKQNSSWRSFHYLPLPTTPWRFQTLFEALTLGYYRLVVLYSLFFLMSTTGTGWDNLDCVPFPYTFFFFFNSIITAPGCSRTDPWHSSTWLFTFVHNNSFEMTFPSEAYQVKSLVPPKMKI